ncbi:MAG: PASTA domain-containing protein [Candidatus Hydrogenedentota bacterium]|nr:MAG: PASTA domain-containing protein [Candidatus Hydrogenedentota bacterium]
MKGRILFLRAATIAAFAIVMARLFQIQILDHEKYLARSLRQSHQATRLERERGPILDRRGEALAVSIRVKSLAADPKRFSDPVARRRIASRLAPLLGISSEEIERRLDRKGDFAWLKRKLPDTVAEAIAAWKEPGLFFETEFRREYPLGSSAAHILGFVGIDDDGLEGIEKTENRLLKGPRIAASFTHDARGNPIPVNGKIAYPEYNGYKVVLTVDAVIQSIAEEALATQVEAYEAKSGSIVVVDPVTGEILALANVPTFDPGAPARSKASARRNRAISDLFEPGSSMKPFVGAIAMEEKLVRSNEIFECRGYLELYGHKIRCYKSHGWLDYARALEVSCNVVAMQVAQRLPKEMLYDGLRRFGYGEKSGIELTGEAAGKLRPVSEWSGLSPVMLGIGQEISVTDLQLAMATSALANGGRLMKPRLVRKILDGEGNVVESFGPKVRRQAVSASTARAMAAALERVVASGTGRRAQVKGYSVAGKTGTGQVADPRLGYLPGHYNAVFIGWTPKKNPVLAMAIVIHEPSVEKGYYGGLVAAPVFQWVATEALSYLEVPGEMGKSIVEKSRRRRARARRQITIRNGRVIMPDLKGLTLRDVKELLERAPIRFRPQGSGVAVGQSIAPGEAVPFDSTVSVTFEPPEEIQELVDIAPPEKERPAR